MRVVVLSEQDRKMTECVDNVVTPSLGKLNFNKP